MSTLTKRRPAVKPATGVYSLALTINGTSYRVIRLQPHPEVARMALRLKKADGAVYDLAVTEHGAECSCPDWVFSRNGKDPAGCKHILASRAFGLLP